MTLGGKYKWKPDSNPPIGSYNTERGYAMTKFQNRSTVIKAETSPYRRPKEQNPEPGQYDGHLKPLGANLKNSFTMGSPYRWKPDSNPPIGAYDLDSGFKATQFQNRSVIIKSDTTPYRRPAERVPEPGQYDKHLIPFGAEAKKFSIG